MSTCHITETGWESAKTLSEALPFIQRYAGQTVLIKFGGHALGQSLRGDNHLTRQFANNVVLLKQFGIHPIIVHGGGPQIGNMLERLAIKSQFIDGLRVSDFETVEVAEMVLSGTINKALVSAINIAGGRAVGLSGRDAGLLYATPIDPSFGFTGQPSQADVAILHNLTKAGIDGGFIPVISPISEGENGAVYNLNADSVAGFLAGALKASRLLLMSNVDGLQDKQGKLLTHLDIKDIGRLIKDGTAQAGMIPKLQTAQQALEAGVHAVVILNGCHPHSLLVELFTDSGAGTLIYDYNQGETS